MENKKFLKKDQLQLINGGYLSDMDGNPVFNNKFVNAQKTAEYVVTFAEMAKNKDFIGKEPDDLNEFQRTVYDSLITQDTEFIKIPNKPKMKITDSLANEAILFMTHLSDTNKIKEVNRYLQKFNIINDFENFGLFFDQNIVKLNKIYSMSEIVKAVKKVIDLI